ncbi:Gfo/Idh/MocA family oxidoreductase [Mesorhizobium sp. M1403]
MIPRSNAVLISTSTDTHSDLVERATPAGKAVPCEKPVDLSLARAQACQKVAAANGKPVMGTSTTSTRRRWRDRPARHAIDLIMFRSGPASGILLHSVAPDELHSARNW